MESLEDLSSFLSTATADGVRGRLLDRGAAWSIMRHEGELPAEAPALGDTLETDLAEYGFSILRAALALREANGAVALYQQGFVRAANAFESLVRNGAPSSLHRGFYRLICAAAYHLAGYSAMAYAILNEQWANSNMTPAEQALTRLILRDLNGLREDTRTWLLAEENGDVQISVKLESGELDADDAIAVIVNSAILRAVAYFDLALQTGEGELVTVALDILATALRLSSTAGAVPLWWITRICRNLISDLWAHSLHLNLPPEPPAGADESYVELRRLFLASLYERKVAEVELWPSQREAARRSTDLADDLVVALPTSAGKTRVAELATLMTLASKKRVLIVTPLRALSAQTERCFAKTFMPLGFTVSSLYGASGVSATDEDALRTDNIVIATPEKLDFALRSDSSFLDDVRLIVLDEGHLIGPTEREIRYEILVQRLLRRGDASTRRIVCLSAILPTGEGLDDLTAWIRQEVPGDPIKSDWRPTRQRFGTLTWQATAARLAYDLNDDGPFLARFVEEVPPKGKQKLPYPRDTKDLTLFGAWKFAEAGKRTLIFVTQANWVEGYGKIAVDLVKRGYLSSLLEDKKRIARALDVGREWLGHDHAAVKALEIGVAVHHGGLPRPFLREIEMLLSEGVLKVTVASPTLSQGLNLNAAVLLVPSLHRASKIITGEEFANVAGRAGRAFVDVEGLVLHVMHSDDRWREGPWRKLVASAKSRILRSGLIQIVSEVLSRLGKQGVLTRPDALEYLANSREAWKAEQADAETGEVDDEEELAPDQEPLSHLIERLDTTVFGLIEALDSDSADLPKLLDEALQGSLWARQIARESEDVQGAHRAILAARANLIWANTTSVARKGHFAMGVGLDAGLIIDSIADELASYIDAADHASLSGDEERLAESLIKLARRLLVIRPFIPDKRNELPGEWESILTAWVTGTDVESIGPHNTRIVEEAFTYRLVWALEALKVRRTMLGWVSDVVSGGGAACLETGVPQLSMALLIRAGLPSRRTAMIAIREGDGRFFDRAGMREWLESESITSLTQTGKWPSADTAAIWGRFRREVLAGGTHTWTERHSKRVLSKAPGTERPPAGTYRVEIDAPDGNLWICTPDYQRLACLKTRVQDPKPSIFIARFSPDDPRALIQRLGRDDATWITEAG